jgi:hypothetical protein
MSAKESKPQKGTHMKRLFVRHNVDAATNLDTWGLVIEQEEDKE